MQSTITFTLDTFFENLTLIGGGLVNGNGNALSNKIYRQQRQQYPQRRRRGLDVGLGGDIAAPATTPIRRQLAATQ